MLPFLKQRRSDAGLSIEYRKPDEGKEPDADESGLLAAASDLVQGVHNKDHKLIVSALRAAFAILDSTPADQDAEDEEI